MKVYYLGPKGSYSYLLASQLYSKDELVPKSSFAEIFSSINQTSESIGLVPVENSITSDVHENIDYIFANEGVFINQEMYLKIILNLICLKEADADEIIKVYSHPKALAQCSRFINENGFEIIETKSTAVAQKLLIKNCNPKEAAIGSSFLIHDDLKIAKKNIGNEKENQTRFLAISKYKNLTNLSEDNKNISKATYIIKLKHRPGSLAELLSVLADNNVNLTKIESRPIPGSQWEYMFWIDMELTEDKIKNMDEIIDENTQDYRLLGIYPVGKTYLS